MLFQCTTVRKEQIKPLWLADLRTKTQKRGLVHMRYWPKNRDGLLVVVINLKYSHYSTEHSQIPYIYWRLYGIVTHSRRKRQQFHYKNKTTDSKSGKAEIYSLSEKSILSLIFTDPCIVVWLSRNTSKMQLVIEFIIPKFTEDSTCFERHTAHHQEL